MTLACLRIRASRVATFGYSASPGRSAGTSRATEPRPAAGKAAAKRASSPASSSTARRAAASKSSPTSIQCPVTIDMISPGQEDGPAGHPDGPPSAILWRSRRSGCDTRGRTAARDLLHRAATRVQELRSASSSATSSSTSARAASGSGLSARAKR